MVARQADWGKSDVAVVANLVFASLSEAEKADLVDKASLIERVHSWRRVLSQDTYMMLDGAAQIGEISRAVQRVLCRIIISQMLVSKGILDTGCWMLDTGYWIPESSMQKVQEEIAGIDLRTFPFEVLSDIYESHLTRKLIVNSMGELEYLPESSRRKGKGIYYTPQYIVRYIVDRTLGKYLWGTENGRPEGNMPAKTPEDIRDLRILDPACGSGSFLAYTFDILAEFYAFTRNIGSAGASPSTGADWLPIILENHLHGIDLDGDAVDITTAILTLKVLELRAKGKEQRAKSKEQKELEILSSEPYALCPMLYALCPNIRQGNFLISDSSTPPVPPQPRPSNDSGFAMILGNPPYGAQLTKAERKLIRSDYETCGSSDSSSLFIEKAAKMLKDKGVLGFIVPKSLSYVVSWRPIREFLLNECRIVEIADARKAFRGVHLEQMVIIAQRKTRDLEHKTQAEACYSSLKSQISSLRSSSGTVVSVLRPEHSLASHVIDSAALSAARFSIWLSDRRIRDIVDKIWERSVPLGHVAEIWSGLNAQCWMLDTGLSSIQHPASSIRDLVRPRLRGRDIQRYHIRPGIQYIKITDAVKRQRPSLEIFCRPKIIAQDIVAHIQNPRPHIKLMATIDRSESWLNVNTVTNIASSEYHLEYLCGILNSRLISWYAYDFIYNRAVRTMHFRRGYADHIPIHHIDRDDPRCRAIYKQLVEYVNEIIALYEVQQAASLFCQGTAADSEIAELDRKIDELICQLYGVTDEDVRFLKEHAGF